ncbi:MAG: PQQ-binding-like beta-propeller repeat protein [Dyadobacter sp.]|uniref:PQQ-binding-like beta-propeller repeat protein n=1 Tax=Dyadobacter sp. TaxID=1914288 RepID=UPI001B2083F5|nr:PQQ-binding-like beta-propeller repeat protein [Dyadobacter sp.]MBO9611319.1 PQQ-binding-like beta-propeller repeat protein [Dyadobacter sp.]
MKLFSKTFIGFAFFAVWSLSACKHQSEEEPAPGKALVILSPETSGKRYALDGETGRIKWVLDRSSILGGWINDLSAPSGKLILANRSLYLHAPFNNPLTALGDTVELFKSGNAQPNLLALDAASGNTKAKFSTLSKPGYSLGCCSIWQQADLIGIYQNLAVLAQYKSETEIPYINAVYAFDMSQNKVIWELGADANSNSVRVDEGKVYISNAPKNRTDVLDIKTGALIATINSFAFAPAGQGMVLVPKEHKLSLVNERTNSIEWTFTASEPVDVSRVAQSKDLIFVTASMGRLYAVDRKTGIRKWEFKADNENYHFTGLTVTDSGIYFSRRNGNIYALDKNTGELSWKAMTGDGIWQYPRNVQVKNNFLYVLVSEKTLLAFDKKSGEKRWEFISPDLSYPILHVFDENDLDFQ